MKSRLEPSTIGKVPFTRYCIVVIYTDYNISKYKHIQNIQDSLDGYFSAMENQEKWVKNQRKFKVIDIVCLLDTLFCTLIQRESVHGRVAAVRS